MEMAFLSVRDNGGLCVLIGNLAHGERIALDPFNLIKGKRIIGSWGGGTQPDNDIPVYVNQYMNRKLDLSGLVTHEYPLEHINEAFDHLRQGDVGRILVPMQ